jgi:F-type H+-transporting ATPase subunit b
MDETLRQIGGLLLGSIPTVIFFLLLYGFYTALVHKPLTRVLAERHARTEGAIKKARADIAAAQARTADYERLLKEARIGLFKAQEARRAQAAQARAALLAEARSKAQAQVEDAQASLEQEKLAAKQLLEGEAGRLASEIIRTVLEPAMAQAGSR